MNDADRSAPAPTRVVRFVDALIRWKATLLALSAVALVVGWPISRGLQFDQSIESLYAEQNPRLVDYRLSKQAFGGDEFALVAFRDPELFASDRESLQPEAEQRIRSFADRLSGIGGVIPASTQTLAGWLEPKAMRLNVIGEIRVPTPARPALRLAESLVVGSDHESTAVVLRLVPEPQSPIPRSETIARIRTAAAEFEKRTGLRTFVVGEPVQVHDMFRYVEQDGRVLFQVSLILLGGVLLVLFRSARWVALPLGVVLATIVWTEAGFVLSRLKLSMVSSMLNSLVTIIGIATVTHLTVHFRELRREQSRTESFRLAVTRLAPAVFWTTATTAFGFLALINSSITPVRSFSLMMSIATMLVLVAAAGLLPGGVLFGQRSVDPLPTPGEEWLGRMLQRVSHVVDRRPRLLGAVFVAFILFAAAGIANLRVETDFSRNFRADSPIVTSLDFVETRLGGAGNWEVNFPAPSSLTPEFLDRVRTLAGRLANETTRDGERQITKVLALTDALDLIPRVPFVSDALSDRLDLMRQLHPELLPGFYHPEGNRMRILLRARERVPSDEKLRLIEQTTRIASEVFPVAPDSGTLPPTATGMYVLLAYLIESLMSDQWTSFAISAAGIVAMMSVAFRSVRIGLISLIPNLFPILAVVGTMGWCDLPINIATAMIASVSMGLTIDSSIHYLAGYRERRAGGATVDEAIHGTHQDVGRALIFANFALIVGFSVLTLSQFIPLVYFGALVNVAMFGGLVGNLFLLPLMLAWIDRDRPNVAVADVAKS